MERKTNSGSLIYKSYIKYDKLASITNTVFKNSNADKCNIYIDLYSVLKPLYSNMYDMSLDKSELDIAAYVINLVAHYRRFFWSRYKTQCKFYLVRSNNISVSSLIKVPNYNMEFSASIMLKKQLVEHINKNIDIVKLLIPFINDACIVDTKVDVSAMMYYMIQENNSRDPNIIITSDPVTMQLCEACTTTVIYRPKKYHGEDNSYYITSNGVYAHLANIRNSKAPTTHISPKLYSLVLAMTRVPERSLTAVYSLNSAMDLLDRAIKSGTVFNGYNNSLDTILSAMNPADRHTMSKNNVVGRFEAMDVIYQYGALLNLPSRFDYQGIENLYDPKSLQSLAMQYFDKTPLDLNYL